MKKNALLAMILLSVIGFFDASYLTWEHFSKIIPPCSTHWWVDCGKVLSSPYAIFLGVPVAILGVLQYAVILGLSVSLLRSWHQKFSWWLVGQSAVGFFFSLYFVLLQVFVIHAICLYCMVSAAMSAVLFLTAFWMVKDKRACFFWILSIFYKGLKEIFFLIDAETIHESMVRFGESVARIPSVRTVMGFIFNQAHPALSQTIAGVDFKTPFGLSAGFDYEARLTQVLYSLGFGFQTVGTISNFKCGGNAKPRLGRLPKSKALLVNKGFKNPGVHAIVRKLSHLDFHNAVGISVGQTNTEKLTSLPLVIIDILETFQVLEKSSMHHSYYELNISCPNLKSDFNFYDPKNLQVLLTRIDKLKLRRPLFIKMPISESDNKILAILKVIATHSPVGVIIGNLQKDRTDPAVVPSERHGMGPGNLSGKPTFKRSNHLIALCYKHYRKRFVIIGCGGVFSAKDAYLKIKLGASLIQLITGMIFEGPQLIAQMNQELPLLLAADGYTSISQAIGQKNNHFKS